LFAAYKCVRAQSVFVFSLRVLVVYTSVEEIHFSPLWVDGLRWRAGHCCFWGAIQFNAVYCQRRLNIPQFPPVEKSPLSPVEISPGAERRL
jgi:hypothetical protein